MYPYIKDGDSIDICTKEEYEIGDIIVFYNILDDSIIIHRILQKNEYSYICKGDNAFRLESVEFDKIVGFAPRFPVATDAFISHSLQIGEAFLKNECDVELTKGTLLYKTYERQYLKLDNTNNGEIVVNEKHC